MTRSDLTEATDDPTASRPAAPPTATARLRAVARAVTTRPAGGAGPRTVGAPSLTASRILVVLTLAPALLTAAWLIAALPLVWVNQFRPLAMAPLFLALAAVIVPWGLRPALRAAPSLRAPWWSLIATVAVAVVYTAFAASTHSEQVIIHRDNGSYAQIGYLLAHTGTLHAQVPADAFGSSSGLMTFSSPAFYHVGNHLIPQFMTGWPSMLAAGWWAAGWTGELVAPALLGGLAILAVAGLTSRLAGPRWAPLSAVLMASAFPVLKDSQTTFSEVPAMLLLAAAVYVLVDFLRLGAGEEPEADVSSRPYLLYAFSAGLLLGISELIRLDTALTVALVLPVVGWLWAARRPGALPYLAGVAVGLGLGAADARFLTWPYVQLNWSSVRLELVALAASAVATTLVAYAARVLSGRPGWERRRQTWQARVSWLGAALMALAGLALLARPYATTARQSGNVGEQQYLVSLQTWVGLSPDGSRTYAEQSLRWVSWYVGWPLMAAAFLAGIALTWRALRGRDAWWLAALLVYIGSAALQLWQPSITPDHPYADRRLVTSVLPGLIMLAVWAAAVVWRAGLNVLAHVRSASLAVRRVRPGVVRAGLAATALVVAAAYVLPSLVATAPVAAKRTELGEIGAANRVCRSLTKDSSVVLVDPMSDQWMAVIREQCGVPVGRLTQATQDGVDQISSSIRAAGRKPVIAASGANALRDIGFSVSQLKKVVVLKTRQDQQQLVKRPNGTKPLNDIEFWYALV